jgi:hypothetical protein
VDLNAVANAVAAALGLGGQTVSIAPNRIWLLGKQRIRDRLVEFFLARGAAWPDSVPVLQATSRLQASPAPIILCPIRLPAAAEWYQAGRMLVSLAELARLEDSRLVIDTRDFEDLHRQIDAGADKPPEPTPVPERASLLDRYCATNTCLIKNVCFWTNVDRGDLSRWKTGNPLIPDHGDRATRIEKLLQRGYKTRTD